jgi:hypothetical protein
MATLQYFIEQNIRKGMEPAAAERKARLQIEEDVFGVGFKRDENGRPIERGIGSASNPSPQHMAALAREKQRRALLEPEPK